MWTRRVIIGATAAAGIAAASLYFLKTRSGTPGSQNAPASRPDAPRRARVLRPKRVDPPGGGVAAAQGGGAMLGVAPDIDPPPMKLRWTYLTNETDRAAVDAAPVISGGVVYVADARGMVHAIDVKTGEAKWKYSTEDGFATSPLILGDRLFIGDLTGVMYGVSIDTGKLIWKRETEAPIHASANSDGTHILLGNDGADVLCLSPEDGKVLWKAQAGDRINAAPGIADGRAFYSGCDAQLRAYEIATGKELFAFDLGVLSPASAVIAGDRVIVSLDQGQVMCVGTDGKTKYWVYEQIEDQALVNASAAVCDGIVVVGARDRQVHAIDLKTGKRVWAYRAKGDVDGSPVISDGRVYVGSHDKKLYVLDLDTGSLIWQFTAGRSIEAGLAIGQGVVVFGDSAGHVYCLEPGK